MDERSLVCGGEAINGSHQCGNEYEATRCLAAMAEIVKSKAAEAALILERLNAG